MQVSSLSSQASFIQNSRPYNFRSYPHGVALEILQCEVSASHLSVTTTLCIRCVLKLFGIIWSQPKHTKKQKNVHQLSVDSRLYVVIFGVFLLPRGAPRGPLGILLASRKMKCGEMFRTSSSEYAFLASKWLLFVSSGGSGGSVGHLFGFPKDEVRRNVPHFIFRVRILASKWLLFAAPGAK